ncbi:acylneuraminate cytidylyltransferase [Hyphomicrobium sp. 99]|uniref:acylneuraminate cytidylyltransferase n=1 Tax=Hyphomicrobium sp. 99 TaxID=1163419 RepID=UPI0009E27A95|nr:acylneuraminate cytidylyltransferase [Hyphomicrobium sp. 99]
MKQTEVLAIIQARGGSKGLPNKNLLPLQGHPLIAYSVASALGAARVTRTIVSTDSEAIADAGCSYGAEAPFRRPALIADDDTPDLPLFQHALDWLWENERYRPEIVVQLRPTTPLRPRGLIDHAISLLESDQKADSVRGVTAPKQTPYKMWQPAEGGYMRPLLDTNLHEHYNLPRQKLPEVLWQTGHIDAIWTRTILEQQSLTGRRVRPIMVDPAYCIDIDTIADFDAAARAMAAETLDIYRPIRLGNSASESKLPATIDLIVFDFDGVFTDNRVLVFSDGTEAVACDRGDGLGISQLRGLGIPLVVLSTEANPVVASRCRKLGLEYLQGLNDKLAALRTVSVDRGVSMSNTIFVGNDVNDLPCLKAVGCAVVPADAHAAVLPHAHLILTRPGGRGAIREFCDVILKAFL